MWRHQLDTGKVSFTKPVYLQIGENEILNLLDGQPSFGMYKDNYIITGIPVNKAISQHTADAKFQISVCQRLTKTALPFNSFLMLTYTQKSFWNIYAKSSPFGDNNYNPGFVLAKPLIYKNQLIGMATLSLEHESNGKDTTESRTWDYLALSDIYFFNASFSVQAKIWAGIMGKDTDDLLKYRGYGLLALNYRSLNDKFWCSAIISPRDKFKSFNTQLEVNFKLSRKENQYFFLQWYNGYGESLLEYNHHTSMLRVGICIKPPLRNLY
jgi:phospholipase A1